MRVRGSFFSSRPLEVRSNQYFSPSSTARLSRKLRPHPARTRSLILQKEQKKVQLPAARSFPPCSPTPDRHWSSLQRCRQKLAVGPPRFPGGEERRVRAVGTQLAYVNLTTRALGALQACDVHGLQQTWLWFPARRSPKSLSQAYPTARL